MNGPEVVSLTYRCAAMIARAKARAYDRLAEGKGRERPCCRQWYSLKYSVISRQFVETRSVSEAMRYVLPTTSGSPTNRQAVPLPCCLANGRESDYMVEFQHDRSLTRRTAQRN